MAFVLDIRSRTAESEAERREPHIVMVQPTSFSTWHLIQQVPMVST